MHQTSVQDRQATFHEISDRFARPEPGDAIEMLMAFLDVTAQLTDTLYGLTELDGYESTSQILQGIYENMVKSERFLKEEAFFALGQSNNQQGEYFTFDAPLPEEFTVENRDNTVQFTFPLWLFGPQKLKDMPPSFHRKRPYVREQVFWNALIRRLLEVEPEIQLRGYIPEEAHLNVRFSTRMKYIKDLDHYHLSPMVNSFVYNGLLISDHPARLSYTVTWQETEPKQVEMVSVSVVYGRSTL